MSTDEHEDGEPSGYRVRRRAADGRWIATNQDTGDVEVFGDRDAAQQWAQRHNRALQEPRS